MNALRCVPSRVSRWARAPARSAALAATFLVSTLAAVACLAQPSGTAVEYHHASFNHYFITADAGEISFLDGGGFGGVWRRTGQTIPVWIAAGPGTLETCRFFTGATYAPKSSHFYTPYAHECTLLKSDPRWQYEGVAFQLMVNATGVCPGGTAPLYRLYNNNMSGAPNHRYTASRAIFEQMRAQTWTPEGSGPATVFACIPGSTLAVAGSGYWDGSFYFLYAGGSSVGLVDGRATFSGSSFSAPQARDFVMRPQPAEYVANVSGTAVAQSRMSGTIATSQRTRTFAATYAGATGAPVSLEQIAGTYDGVAASQEGSIEILLTVSPSGAVSGSSAGCTFTGTLWLRGTTASADATIVHGGTGCALGSASTTGIAVYMPDVNGLLIVTQSPDLDDVFMFVGVK
jgi:hypothetical protein